MKTVLLSGLILAFAGGVLADEDEKTAKLIRGLNADNAKDRELAAAQLARLGPTPNRP